jgi:hypothetical protein
VRRLGLVLGLLAWASVAEGECDRLWILWNPVYNEQGIPLSNGYTPALVFESRAPCEERAAKTWDELKGETRQKPFKSPSQCLPDSIDPRGPKR